MSEPFRKESIGLVAQEKLFLTSDGKIVLEGDRRAATLLAAKGQVVPEKLAKRLKLDSAKVEPLEKAATGIESATGGFHVKHGGFNHPATTAPEDISSRSTRPEKPASVR